MKVQMPSLVLLAAGASSRFLSKTDRPKFLHQVRGRNWIDRQIESFVEFGFKEIITVFGHHLDFTEKFAPHLLDLRLVKLSTIHPVINMQPDLGPFSSLLTALRECDDRNVLVCPTDVPCPSLKTIEEVISVPAGKQVGIPRYNKKNGHPVLLKNEFVKTLLQLSPEDEEARLDHQIKKLAEEYVEYVDVDSKEVVANFNTQKDFDLFFE